MYIIHLSGRGQSTEYRWHGKQGTEIISVLHCTDIITNPLTTSRECIYVVTQLEPFFPKSRQYHTTNVRSSYIFIHSETR